MFKRIFKMIKVDIIPSIHDFGHDVRIYSETPDGQISVLTDIKTWTFEKYKPGQKIESVFNTSYCSGVFQALVDALYEIGIKAKKEPVLENELTAVRDHLKDMQKLVCTSDISRKADEKIDGVKVKV